MALDAQYIDEPGVLEPTEEVGYKNRPPLLEDVSVEGPLRIPIPHSLDTKDERTKIEEDYNWWRYSSFAFPWLLVLLTLFIVLFGLTAWEQVGDIQGLRDGTPTYFQYHGKEKSNSGAEGSDDSTEGGMKKVVRDLRISAIWLTFWPALIAFIVLVIKPRPKTRKLLHLVCVFLLFVGMVLCWAAFGIGEKETKKAQRCPELYLITNEKCDNKEGIALIALCLDFVLAITALTACLALAWATLAGDFRIPRTGWRQQERDAEQDPPTKNPLNIKSHKTRSTRVVLTSIALGLVILFAIAQAVTVIVLHLNHNELTVRSGRGRSNRTFDRYSNLSFEEAGWPARNTRLRYAVASIGILAILLNLLPWRSRVIAYLFGFIYFVLFVLAIVVFCFDVHELRKARNDLDCPSLWHGNLDSDLPSYTNLRRGINCVNAPYVACAIVDMFAAAALIIYIVMEYVLRYKSVHSQRKYPLHQLRKIEKELDSRRPIRCETTSEVMTAKDYYYEHRFLSEAEMLQQSAAAPDFTPIPAAAQMGPPVMYDQPPPIYSNVPVGYAVPPPVYA